MSKEPEQLSNPIGNETVGRLRVLVICLPGAKDLGREVHTLIQPSRNIESSCGVLTDFDSARCSAILGPLISNLRPTLLLLCVSSESASSSEIVFESIQKKNSELSIIAILRSTDLDQLQRLFTLGTADFCLAPVSFEDLLPRMIRWSSISKARASRQLSEKTLGLQQFLGESPRFVEVVSQIPKLARCDAHVCITGETGTGKEMCARAIHHLGPRADHPFVPVNCGAIPSELVENELFGHDAGAFTSATSAVRGLVYEAEGGTLFLDEIDSLPLQTQVKFLRFLQDQEYRPLGARRTTRADIRIIAASNADLEEVVRSRKFRSDLYYRLNVLPLRLPPLRERWADIPLLARHFVTKFARKFSLPVNGLSHSALEKLLAYEWPGNIRELENIIERAIVLSDGLLISSEDICLPREVEPEESLSFKVLKARAVTEFETSYIHQLLIANDGNISKAARAAKKNRRAFFELMRKHDIVAPATRVSFDDAINSSHAH